QARKEEAVRMTLAAEEAADQARRLAATADLHRRDIASQIALQIAIGFDDGWRRSIRDQVRVAVWNDQHIARLEGDFLAAAETRDSLPLGQQVIADHALGARCEVVRVVAQGRYGNPPRAGAFGVIE